MFALRLEYLTGRVVATAYNDRNAVEWPPHPARLFSALVSIWANDRDPAERDALQWLEGQPAPAVACSDIARRSVLTHYVPVNDTTLLGRLERWRDKLESARENLAAATADLESAAEVDPAKRKRLEKVLGKTCAAVDKAQSEYLSAIARLSAWTGEAPDADYKAAQGLLPEGRLRHGRTFPSGVPDDPVVHFIWPDAQPGVHRHALERLVARLVNLGHSSSLVHARVVDTAPQPAWIPDEQGDLVMRWVSVGQLQRLEFDYAQHQGVEPRVMSFAVQRYRQLSAATAGPIPQSLFGSEDWLILRRVGGMRLPLARTVDLVRALRGALMRYAQQPPATVLSGHESDGSPARGPHLAIVPLPNVGHRHGDGSILGAALVMPRQLSPEQRRAVLAAVGRWEEQSRRQSGHEEDDAPVLTLGLGNGIEIEMQRVAWGRPPLHNLRPRTWCGPVRQWASVTPVALDRNPGDLFSANKAKRDAAYAAAAEILARSCSHVGLPEPQSVVILPGPTVMGSIGARQFAPFPGEPGKLRRVLVHAHVTFAEPIAGPVLLGAGRFHGLGLFRPVTDDGGA